MRSFFSLGLVVFALGACAPYSMMRDQERLGLINWMAQAGKQGYLDVAFYNVGSLKSENAMLAAMEGHNYGPVFSLKKAEDTGKGLRMVVYQNPARQIYGNALCTKPTPVSEPQGKGENRVTLALCYNDLSYGNVRARSSEGELQPGTQFFNEFYRAAFRYLTDPKYERQEHRSDCKLTPC